MLLNVVEIEKYYGTRNNLKKALEILLVLWERPAPAKQLY